MTDREKLLEFYNKLKDIKPPELENTDLQKLVNTVSEGLIIILDWISDTAKKHFVK